MRNSISKAGIVTVFYNPPDSVLDVFIMFAKHGYFVVIYNNGISRKQLSKLRAYSMIKIVGGGKNVGLASGLNVALQNLWQNQHVDGVMLLDQDSMPDVLLPEKLRHSYIQLSANTKIACIGPRIVDVKKIATDKPSSNLFFLEKAGIATSGTYMGKAAYFKIGSFMDELFVDCIDHEWCFRARSYGYKVFIDMNCSMLHDMGEIGVNFWGVYKPGYSSPVRHYYIVRNTLAMLRFLYVPLSWKIREIFKTIRRICFYVIVSSDRKSSIKNIGRGIIDGLKGHLGAMDALRKK